MYQYYCLNPIAEVGLKKFDGNYARTDKMENADAILVRSAAMHDIEFPESVCVIGRAGAGTNNIPMGKCSEQGIAVFNTPGANANGVKELVLAGLLLASRDIIGGLYWVRSERQNEELGQLAEKQKKAFAGNEIMGKKLGVIGLGAIGILVANAAASLGMEVYGYDPYISVNAAWKLSREAFSQPLPEKRSVKVVSGRKAHGRKNHGEPFLTMAAKLKRSKSGRAISARASWFLAIPSKTAPSGTSTRAMAFRKFPLPERPRAGGNSPGATRSPKSALCHFP